MKNQIYNVSLIPPDLRREETVKQIADSLDYLNQIANDIFKRISAKVAENKIRLKTVNDRTVVAQMKIDKIKGSNKATKVFCSAKYPGSEAYEYQKTIFPAKKNNAMEIKRSSHQIHTKHPIFDDKILKEKLQFYNLRWHIDKQNKYDDQTTEEGLGQLPKNLTSVSSLLLFNTSENPYKKYVMLDPLGAVTKTRKALVQDEDDEGMGAAPLSIIHREELEHHTSENYFYNPGLGEVPEIDVPLDLPDLPGIADDLAYSGDIGPTIAPSVPGSNLPVLPAIIPDLPSPSTMEVAPPPLINSSSLSIATPPPPPPAAPPPPPPFVEPPPPPPPPPPAENVPEPQENAAKMVKVEGAPAEVTQPGDARANLLESIRQAGGKAKLRSVQDRKIEAKKKKKEEKASGGGTGDLMADLYAKLSMRRKGISGAARTGSTTENFSDAPSLTNNTAMDRVSAMIPPPPKPAQVDEPIEDEDWN